MTTQKFYVYVYLRRDGSPYYVGKGQGIRWKRQHRVEIPSPDRVIFLITQTTEDWSHFMEMEFIDKHGRLNDGTGILENWTDGGEGCSGAIRSEETKRKISETTKGKIFAPEHKLKLSESAKGRKLSEETKKKIGETGGGMKGKKHSEETKQKMAESAKGKQNIKGYIWINDGSIRRLIPKTEPIPTGFIVGMKLSPNLITTLS